MLSIERMEYDVCTLLHCFCSHCAGVSRSLAILQSPREQDAGLPAVYLARCFGTLHLPADLGLQTVYAKHKLFTCKTIYKTMLSIERMEYDVCTLLHCFCSHCSGVSRSLAILQSPREQDAGLPAVYFARCSGTLHGPADLGLQTVCAKKEQLTSKTICETNRHLLLWHIMKCNENICETYLGIERMELVVCTVFKQREIERGLRREGGKSPV